MSELNEDEVRCQTCGKIVNFESEYFDFIEDECLACHNERNGESLDAQDDETKWVADQNIF